MSSDFTPDASLRYAILAVELYGNRAQEFSNLHESMFSMYQVKILHVLPAMLFPSSLRLGSVGSSCPSPPSPPPSCARSPPFPQIPCFHALSSSWTSHMKWSGSDGSLFYVCVQNGKEVGTPNPAGDPTGVCDVSRSGRTTLDRGRGRVGVGER
eukprot:751594-Hanusia_phi.AAC.2